MKRYTTIKDIASYLNISTSTVSRALSDSWDVNTETRKKVLEAAKKLDYHPNAIAKNLHQKSSGIIGVIIPEFTNSFFPNVILGIQEVLHQENYQMLIAQSNESALIELDNLKALENSRAEGFLISITREGGNAEEYKRLIKSGTPIVFFNRCCDQVKASKVLIKDKEMAFKAVEHLIKSGYKRIAHFTGPSQLSLSQERKQGYLDALKAYHLPVDEKLIVEAGVLMEKGNKAMQEFLASPTPLPDAIFAFNDPIAIGIMQVLKERHIQIPQDMAVVGFSESTLATIIEPHLTSILQPTYEMGRQAATLLVEQLKNPQRASNKTVYLDATLNIRESSQRITIPKDE